MKKVINSVAVLAIATLVFVSCNKKKEGPEVEVNTGVLEVETDTAKIPVTTVEERGSRVSPYIRFSQDKKLHRQALTLEHLAFGYDGEDLFSQGELILEAGTPACHPPVFTSPA